MKLLVLSAVVLMAHEKRDLWRFKVYLGRLVLIEDLSDGTRVTIGHANSRPGRNDSASHRSREPSLAAQATVATSAGLSFPTSASSSALSAANPPGVM